MLFVILTVYTMAAMIPWYHGALLRSCYANHDTTATMMPWYHEDDNVEEAAPIFQSRVLQSLAN